MQTLSLAMIVKNEERTLARILAAAKTFCDELVVVDTGSTDNTVEIARSMGAKIFHFAWTDDFSAARNYAFAQCTQDWIIWLDADDTVDEASQQAIRNYKTSILDPAKIDALYLPYRAENTLLSRERILRRAANLVWIAPVHEVIPMPKGRAIARDDATITHATAQENVPRRTGRNIGILDRWFKVNGDVRLLYLYGTELLHCGRYKESSDILTLYMHRNTVNDAFGERYWAIIKLADALKAQRRYDEALKWCLEGIESDGARAEAFCLMGIIHVEQEQWRRAWPCLVAAATMEPPTGLCAQLPEFYNQVPMKLLKTCFEKLNKPSTLRLRLITLGIMTT